MREQNCVQALQQLGDSSLSAGNYETAVGYFQRAASLDPWSDTVRRGWMEALANQGDSNAALQVYREFLNRLKNDPTAAPDAQTIALYQRLRTEVRQRAGTLPVLTAQVRAVPTMTGYLPHPRTELVGRKEERIEVAAHLRRSRLVTLTGVGGIGKTRLALAVASDAVASKSGGEYADGVWLVALEALSDGNLLPRQIASVLGLKEEAGRPLLTSLTEHLRHKNLLLVLDNCEHLLKAGAHLAAHLLQSSAGVHILVTSREALGITGETVRVVPALAVPDPEHLPQADTHLPGVLMGYASVQLFVERTQSVQTAFTLTGENASAVARVCSQLEGIPLAIELAAARGRTMEVEHIANRLDDHLSLLTGENGAVLPRQQTMRTTLDWSYELLQESERRLLHRLSVFVGGWSLEAAEAVCAEAVCADVELEANEIQNPKSKIQNHEVLDLLTSLIDKSLVVFGGQPHEAGGRYHLLEMVRQYAAESLQASGETEQVRARHRDWCVRLAEKAEPELRGADQERWLQRLETEHNNLRAALHYCSEFRVSSDESSERSVQHSALQAEIGLQLAGALWRFWYIRGHLSEGRHTLERALTTVEAEARTLARAKALNGAGALAYDQSDYAAAQSLFEESLSIRRDLADGRGIAETLSNLGNVAHVRGDYVSAKALFEESISLRRELGDRPGLALTLGNLGNLANSRGDLTTARALYEESLHISRGLKDRLGTAWTLRCLGNAVHQQGDVALARTLHEESLSISRELGHKRSIAWALRQVGDVAYAQGDYASARALYEEGLNLTREMGDRRGGAWALKRLGDLSIQEGDYAFAQRQHTESLNLFMAIGDKVGIAEGLEAVALVLLEQEQTHKAVRLWGTADTLRKTIGAPFSTDGKVKYDQMVEQARSTLGEAAFAVAWVEGCALSWEQAAVFALAEEEPE